MPFALGLLLVANVPACDPAFEGLERNDRYHFSIYGYLDSSADTQWVRVMPVREHFFSDTVPVDAVVTLRDLDSGHEEVMRDSLFRHGERQFTWNFWTTMPLSPGGEYRLTAERSDGEISRAVVRLPADFPAPSLYVPPPGPPSPMTPLPQVFAEVNDELAEALVLYCVRGISEEGEGFRRLIPVPILRHAVRLPGGSTTRYRITIRDADTYIENQLGDAARYHANPRQVVAAEGGPGWIDFNHLEEGVEAVPDGISNVENGTGFLGGIVSKTVPFQSCSEGGQLVPCPTEPRATGPHVCQ